MSIRLLISRIAAVGCIAFLPVLPLGCSAEAPAEGALPDSRASVAEASEDLAPPSVDRRPETCATCAGKCAKAVFVTYAVNGKTSNCHYQFHDPTRNDAGPIGTKTTDCGYNLVSGDEDCVPMWSLRSECK